MGKELGLCPSQLRKFALEDRGYTAMQLLAPGPQHRAIGSILHQRVLEGVFRIRRDPAPKNQFGVLKLNHGIIHLILRHLRHGTNQLV